MPEQMPRQPSATRPWRLGHIILTSMIVVWAVAGQCASVMTLPSSFAVDHTGAATLNVPLDVPPGTAGLAPHLSLSYSSSNGNGYVGVGWTLTGLPAIARCPSTIATNVVAGAVNFTSSDVFCFQGQPLVQAQQQSAVGQQASQKLQFEPGQQLVSSSGTYGADLATYSTEIEAFSRIVSHTPAGSNGPLWFQVYTRSGLIYEFGNTTDSRELCTALPQCPSGQTSVKAWELDKVTDTVGNSIIISYQQDTQRAYPIKILYTQNVSQGIAATNSVSFGYDWIRTDAPLQFLGGQQMQTRGRLRTIQTQVAISGVWTNATLYTLNYNSGLTGRNRLVTVTRTGQSGGTLLPSTFTYCDLCGAPADLLNTLTNGLAPPTTITYELTTHTTAYKPGPFTGAGAPTYPSQNLTTPRYVAVAVFAPNGVGGTYIAQYTYSFGQTDQHGRGFLGFQITDAYDPQTQLLKEMEYYLSFPIIGQVQHELVEHYNNTTFTQLTDVEYAWLNWYVYVLNATRTFPYLSSRTSSENDLSGAPMPTTQDTYQVDLYGNPQQDVKTQQYLTPNFGNSNAVFTTTTNNAFQNDQAGWTPTNGTNWIIGRTTTNSIAASFTDNNNPGNSSGTTTRTTTYVPDPTTGFTTTETVQPGTGAGFTLATNYTYDAFGNRMQASSVGDGLTRTTSTTYGSSMDTGHEFPDVMRNPLSQQATQQFDLRWGLPVSVTTINGQITTYQYDDLGRKTVEQPNDGSTMRFSYLWCQGINGGSLTCPSGGQYGVQTTHIGKDGSTQLDPIKTSFYDILDRELDIAVQGFDGTLSYVTKTYNGQLQLASVTRPYFMNASPAVTSYTYDPLNRVTQTNYPDGSWTTVGYVQTSQSTTVGITSNYGGENTWKLYDGLGNLAQTNQGVTENGTFVTLSTYFLRDGFSNLTRVTDPVGNKTAYAYDLLGRKTSIADPDAGSRTQTYNAFGDLTSIIDGQGTEAWMAYDALDRMQQRCWTNGSQTVGDVQSCAHTAQYPANETLEKWSYDPANGIGEPAGETSTDGSGYSDVLTYNVLGQPLTKNIVVGSKSYPYSYSYDGNNRPSSYTSPSSAQPITSYNPYGYVQSQRDGPSGTVVWTVESRNAELQLTSALFGNATSPAFGYDPTTGLENAFVTSDGSDQLQYTEYGHDSLGNTRERLNVLNNLDEVFNYDELNRLATITLPKAGNSVENSFSYDVLGNMLSKGDIGSYTFPPAGSAQPHGVRSIAYTAGGTTSFNYDQDGNLLSGAGRTLTWKLFNKPASIAYLAQTFTWQYDADHNAVLKSVAGSSSTYLPDGELDTNSLAKPNGGTQDWHTYFESDGQRVAEDWGPPNQLAHHYFHNDPQGSIAFVTDDSYNQNTGTGIDQNSGFDAFGQPRNANGTPDPNWGANAVSDRGYINQRQLTPLHLVDLNARIYDPAIAQFLSPDPIISDQDDSQSWNAYAYSHNNPLTRDDPSGLEDIIVHGKTSEEGSLSASVSSKAGGPGAHLASGVARLAARAAQSGRNSPAARSLESFGLAATTAAVGGEGFGFAGTAGSIAVACPECVFGAALMFVISPSEMANDDTLSSQTGDQAKPDLTDEKGANHILDSDETGGGHRAGTGKSGKSEFPPNWSDAKIKGEISDVATDPNATRITQNGRNGTKTVSNGTRDGIDIRTVDDGKRIITGHPTNTPRNPPQ